MASSNPTVRNVLDPAEVDSERGRARSSISSVLSSDFAIENIQHDRKDEEFVPINSSPMLDAETLSQDSQQVPAVRLQKMGTGSSLGGTVTHIRGPPEITNTKVSLPNSSTAPEKIIHPDSLPTRFARDVSLATSTTVATPSELFRDPETNITEKKRFFSNTLKQGGVSPSSPSSVKSGVSFTEDLKDALSPNTLAKPRIGESYYSTYTSHFRMAGPSSEERSAGTQSATFFQIGSSNDGTSAANSYRSSIFSRIHTPDDGPRNEILGIKNLMSESHTQSVMDPKMTISQSIPEDPDQTIPTRSRSTHLDGSPRAKRAKQNFMKSNGTNERSDASPASPYSPTQHFMMTKGTRDSLDATPVSPTQHFMMSKGTRDSLDATPVSPTQHFMMSQGSVETLYESGAPENDITITTRTRRRSNTQLNESGLDAATLNTFTQQQEHVRKEELTIKTPDVSMKDEKPPRGAGLFDSPIPSPRDSASPSKTVSPDVPPSSKKTRTESAKTRIQQLSKHLEKLDGIEESIQTNLVDLSTAELSFLDEMKEQVEKLEKMKVVTYQFIVSSGVLLLIAMSLTSSFHKSLRNFKYDLQNFNAFLYDNDLLEHGSDLYSKGMVNKLQTSSSIQLVWWGIDASINKLQFFRDWTLDFGLSYIFVLGIIIFACLPTRSQDVAIAQSVH